MLFLQFISIFSLLWSGTLPVPLPYGYRRSLPLEPFFELTTWSFEKHYGPVVFTGLNQKESAELADSFIKYYAKEVTDNIININCTGVNMDDVFRSIAEFYMKEVTYETNTYDIIDSIHEYFSNKNTLFVLEDPDLDDRYTRKFLKGGRDNMLTDILLTNVQSFLRGKYILLDFDIYRSRGIMYVIRGLTADLRAKYNRDHNVNTKKDDTSSILAEYTEPKPKESQFQDPLFLKYYNKFAFKKEEELEDDDEDVPRRTLVQPGEFNPHARKTNPLTRYPKAVPKTLYQNELYDPSLLNDDDDPIPGYGYDSNEFEFIKPRKNRRDHYSDTSHEDLIPETLDDGSLDSDEFHFGHNDRLHKGFKTRASRNKITARINTRVESKDKKSSNAEESSGYHITPIPQMEKVLEEMSKAKEGTYNLDDI